MSSHAELRAQRTRAYLLNQDQSERPDGYRSR